MEIPFTGGSFDSPTPVTVNVPLVAGANTFRFYNDTAYGPDLDRIVIGGSGAPAGWTISPSDPVTTPSLGAGQTLERQLDGHAARRTRSPARTTSRWTATSATSSSPRR